MYQRSNLYVFIFNYNIAKLCLRRDSDLLLTIIQSTAGVITRARIYIYSAE